MALTMVHLLAADKWARKHPRYLECPEYYLGAISPDAIHVRDHDDKSHKDEIHLFNWRSLHIEPVVAYWRAHATPFDIGYGVHVLTDAQWVPRFHSRLPGLLLENGRVNQDIYYTDCYLTDFELLRRSPRLREIMEMTMRAEVPESHPLLGFREFDGYRRVIHDIYSGECPRSGAVQWVTPEFIYGFIDDSTALIDELYEKAFA